ncbi:MAG: NAD-dependent epimerase/dehydratase family protein [Elusimicrobiaceae bacterium]|nr:NAD-dependent epimerase/dehydratase family protein [Elusimicrobiaceae bacterium]
MKLLILGGTKFFGLEFAAARAQAGDDVTVFSRACPVSGLPHSVAQINGDRENREALLALSRRNWDAVVDNICYSPAHAETACTVFSGRTRLYVFTSTGDVHLPLEGAASPYTEEMAHNLPAKPGFAADPANAYAWGKYQAEAVFLKARLAVDFPVCIARFPIVIGPREPRQRALSYWLRLADGFPLVLPDGGNYYRRYIYSGDCVRALSAVIDNPHKTMWETFHFGDSAPITLREFITVSAQELNLKQNVASAPYEKLLKLGFGPDWSPFFHPGHYVLGITKAEHALGWRSTPLRDWLRATAADELAAADPQLPPPGYRSRQTELSIIDKL